MMQLKWKIILPTINLVIAILLSFQGSKESLAFRKTHPSSPYEPTFVYIPPAEVVSSCINVPPFVLSNLLENSRVWKVVRTRAPIRIPNSAHFTLPFYLFLFLFWCWIGWRIDVASRPGQRGQPTKSSAVLWAGTAMLSLFLAYAGIQVVLVSHPFGDVSGERALGISMLVWGLGLTSYCVVMLLTFANPKPAQTVAL
jgi:hypothetical protein